MQLNYYQQSKMRLIGALGLIFSLVSCGSYQYAGYDDGIYGNSKRNVGYPAESSNKEVTSQSSSYYQNYFKEKSQELDYLSQDDVIFTDIDSYEGNYEAENDTLVDTQVSYAGWGQNTTEVSINVYNSGYLFNNWWNRPYYSYGYGYGFYNHWYNPYRFYGYSNWYNPYGYYGYNNWYNPYHGYGYGNYYSNYYNRRGIAYNAGRRGAIYQNSYVSHLNRRSLTSSRNSTTYRPRRALNSNVRANTNTVTRPRTTTRRDINNTIRPRSTTRRTINNTTRPRTRSYKPSRSSTRTRSYTPSRSSTRSSSPSRSSSRSTGSTSRRRGN
ncbi:hypothetical protein JYU05_01600 [bacterium AH-315-P13]|nr:hypothetical protein [bacterium AH-315-P13]